METLTVLEKKIALLLETVKELKAKNDRLVKENTELIEKVEALETSILKNGQTIEEEKVLTKIVIDDLIKSIDSLVANEEVAVDNE